MKSIGSIVMCVGLGSTLWAAGPVAMWDRDFTSLTKSGYTLNLGSGNSLSSDSSAITLGSSVGVCVNCPDATKLSSVTVVVRYSGLTLPESGWREFAAVLSTSDAQGQSFGRPGVACDSAGKTKGVWTSGIWESGTSTQGSADVACSGEGNLAFVYMPTTGTLKGVTLYYKNAAADWTVDYFAGGLVSSSDNGRIYGVSVGGPAAAMTGVAADKQAFPFAGMKIHGVALFSSAQSASEIAAFSFPSETVYSTSVSGNVRWSDLSWNHADNPDSKSKVTLNVSGDARLDVDAELPSYASLSVLGAGSLTLVGDCRLAAQKLSSAIPLKVEVGGKTVTLGSGVEMPAGGSVGQGSWSAGDRAVVAGAVVGDGELVLNSGRFEFADGLSHTGGTRLESSATAVVTGGSFGSSPVVGSGVACFRGVVPDAATLLNFKDVEKWSGTCRLEKLDAGLLNIDINTWGHAGSKVCFAGIPASYFTNATTTGEPELILEDLVEGEAVTPAIVVNNGYGSQPYTLRKLSGSGTFDNISGGYGAKQLIFVNDGSGFRGSLKIGNMRWVFGVWEKGYPAIGDCGRILVQDAESLEIGVSNSWYAANGTCGVQIMGRVRCKAGVAFLKNASDDASLTASYAKVEVQAGGVLEMYSPSDPAENQTLVDAEPNRDYRWLTGSGTLHFTDGGLGNFRVWPNPARTWAETLAISNDFANGILLVRTGDSTAEKPCVYKVGTLSGAGTFRSDAGVNAENRSLQVTQAANSLWTGAFGGLSDRFAEFIVAGDAKAAERTLTMTGDSTKFTDRMNVTPTGSVLLNGKWKGDIAVAGEFGGSGVQTAGTLTFAEGSTILAASQAFHAASLAALPADLSVRVVGPCADKIKLLEADSMTLAHGTRSVRVVADGKTRMRVLSVESDGVYLYWKPGLQILVR